MLRISSSEPRALGVSSTSAGNGGIGMDGQIRHIAGAGIDQDGVGLAPGIGGNAAAPPAICRYMPSRSALFLLTTATRRPASGG